MPNDKPLRSGRSASILIIEDSDADLALVSRQFSLQLPDIEIESVSSVDAALKSLNQNKYDAVICDLSLPGGSGLDVVRFIRSADETLPIVVLTGHGDEASAVEAIKRGANDYVVKDTDAFARMPGQIWKLIETARDEQDRLRTLAELHQTQARFRDFAEAASDFFWEMGADLRFTIVSKSVRQILGLEPAYFLGKTQWDLVKRNPPEDWAMHEETVAERRRFRDFVYEIETSEGEWRTLRVSGTPFFDDDGGFLGYRGVGADITDQVAIAEQLRRALVVAEEASRAKSQFLAVMSHELRTPLNAIIGFTEVLASNIAGPVNERQAEYLGDIRDAGYQLLSLVDDILDISKIQAHRYDVTLQKIDVRAALGEATHLVAKPARDGELQLSIDDDPDGLFVFADSRALKQILLNLLSNAIKFTLPGGCIEISAQPVEGGVKIVIADNGIGISKENLMIVRQPFQQVDDVLSRRFHGTGLGLAIVDGLVRAHGGTFALESEVGKGTTARVRIPARTSRSWDDSP